jgi:hypothetical protein
MLSVVALMLLPDLLHVVKEDWECGWFLGQAGSR